MGYMVLHIHKSEQNRLLWFHWSNKALPKLEIPVQTAMAVRFLSGM